MASIKELWRPEYPVKCTPCEFEGVIANCHLVWFNHQPVQTLEAHCPFCDQFITIDHSDDELMPLK